MDPHEANPRPLSFVLNDHMVETVGRTTLMLALLVTFGDQAEVLDLVITLWYSARLSDWQWNILEMFVQFMCETAPHQGLGSIPHGKTVQFYTDNHMSRVTTDCPSDLWTHVAHTWEVNQYSGSPMAEDALEGRRAVIAKHRASWDKYLQGMQPHDRVSVSRFYDEEHMIAPNHLPVAHLECANTTILGKVQQRAMCVVLLPTCCSPRGGWCATG